MSDFLYPKTVLAKIWQAEGIVFDWVNSGSSTSFEPRTPLGFDDMYPMEDGAVSASPAIQDNQSPEGWRIVGRSWLAASYQFPGIPGNLVVANPCGTRDPRNETSLAFSSDFPTEKRLEIEAIFIDEGQRWF